MRRISMLLLAGALLLLGCWDARSLDQRAFVVMMGVDTAPEGRFKVTMQMQRAGYEQAGGQRETSNAAKVVISEGTTLRQAVERARDDMARELDHTFLDVIVLSREIATEHLEEVDWIVRTFRVPVSAWVVVAPDEAEPVVRARVAGHPMPAQFAVFGLMSGGWNRSPAIVRGHMWMMFNRNYFTPLEDPFAPVLSGEGGKLSWNGLAAFKGHRLVGYLSEQDASNFNLLQAERAERTITAQLPAGGTATLYLQDVDVRRKVTWTSGGPVIHLWIRGRGNLQELIRAHAQNEAAEAAVERAISRHLEEEVKSMLRRLQELESDPIGFGELARQAAPYRREVQSGEAWHKAYKAARLDVSAAITMISPGYMK